MAVARLSIMLLEPQEGTMKQRDTEHGEGNYKATRDYNEATKKFMEKGKVEEAARKAEPADAREAQEMQEAEQAGKSRARSKER